MCSKVLGSGAWRFDNIFFCIFVRGESSCGSRADWASLFCLSICNRNVFLTLGVVGGLLSEVLAPDDDFRDGAGDDLDKDELMPRHDDNDGLLSVPSRLFSPPQASETCSLPLTSRFFPSPWRCCS